MKNVKTFFMFKITTMLASAYRVLFLGGNFSYCADGDNGCTSSPHTINNSNLAQEPRTSPHKKTATLNYIW